jgi:GDPmannose 4,6-dehydratase
MNNKTALITGLTGQDGSYLAEFLLSKGYKVYGLVRRTSNNPMVRLEGILGKVNIVYGNLRDIGAIERALEEANPDEIYNLAAQSDVGISFKCPEETIEINYYGVGRLVNAAMKKNPNVKIYHASTSEMFGDTPPPQNEETKFSPVSPYGEAKLKAHEDFVVGYREKHNLFICSGILFNHESPRRGRHFVTRKITVSLAKIKLGLQDHMELGNLEAKRDWGFAGDYVKVMWMMLQQDMPEDFVISTGETHTVRDFVNASAKALEMDIVWEGKGLDEVAKDRDGKIILKINKDFYRPNEVNALLGDSTKAKNILGWDPEIKFEELVAMMAKFDFEDLKEERSS